MIDVQAFMTWLMEPRTLWATAYSAVALAGAVLVYLILRRRIRRSDDKVGPSRRTGRLLPVSVVLLLLFVLGRIWTGAVPALEHWVDNTVLDKAIWTLAVAAGVYLAVVASEQALERRVTDIESRHRIRLAASWIGLVVFLIIATMVWTAGVRDLGLFLGIIGAGVALSLQESLLCVAGWLLFIMQRPFDIGDRIEIDGRIGDVIGVSVFQTSLLEVGNWVAADQSTGRMLIVPNSSLFRHAVYNYTKGFPFVWDELTTVVTFESDWELAEKLMLEKAEIEAERIERQVKQQIRLMQSRYAIHYDRLTPIVYTTIADNGVALTLRYLTPVRERRTLGSRIARNILRTFIEHPEVDFAYTTTRIFRNNEEGKIALRPEASAPPTTHFEQAGPPSDPR